MLDLSVPSKAMRRASRSAAAVEGGQEIFEFVTRKLIRRKLVAAAQTGVPPVSAISGELQERFRSRLRAPIVKQFIGLCVRGVMEEAGYEVFQAGVRLHRDPVFTGGFKWSSQHSLYELFGGTGPEPRPVFSSPGSFAACC